MSVSISPNDMVLCGGRRHRALGEQDLQGCPLHGLGSRSYTQPAACWAHRPSLAVGRDACHRAAASASQHTSSQPSRWLQASQQRITSRAAAGSRLLLVRLPLTYRDRMKRLWHTCSQDKTNCDLARNSTFRVFLMQ